MIYHEVAAPAAAFADSIGVVTHFQYADTPYGKRFDTVAERLIALGVRHVREGVVRDRPELCERERLLAARGVRFSYVTQPDLDASALVRWAQCAGPAIEGFEGPNEYDVDHPASDTAWPATLRAFQHTLYAAVKTEPALRGLAVIGPSLTSAAAFGAVGDLSNDLDFGNMHDYFGTREPGTGGWGDGGYGSIPYNIALARIASGAKPIVATESGYGTEEKHGDVTEAVQAAYIPRLMLDHFAAGVVRTDEYELLDEGYEPYSHYGLLRPDLSPKPAYETLRSLLRFFHDAGKPRAMEALDYSLDGDTAHLRHELLEKNDGTFELALWAERPSLDADTRAPLPVPTQVVRVKTLVPARLTTFTYSDGNQLVPGTSGQSEQSIALGDRVVIVRIARSAFHG